MSYGMDGWCKSNNDTISRQETIDTLFYYLNGKKCPDDGTTVAKLIKEYVIDNIPSAQPERKWIPCGERLPEHGGWYITTYRITKDNNNRVGLLWYSTLHGWEWDNAIAWMPLPEPYREDDHDNT